MDYIDQIRAGLEAERLQLLADLVAEQRQPRPAGEKKREDKQ